MNKLLKYLKGNKLKSKLLSSFTGLFFLSVINTLLIFGLSILLARSLGAENYGIYVFIISVISLLGLPAKAGLPLLIIRETAKYKLNKKWSCFNGLLTLANVFVISFSILIIILVVAVTWWLWRDEQSVRYSAFLWALLLIPLVAFVNIRGATLQGLGKAIQGRLPEELVQPLVIILLFAATLWLESELTPVLAVQYRIMATIVAFVIGTFMLSRTLSKKIFRTKRVYKIKIWGASLLSFSLFHGLKIGNSEFMTIIIGFLSSAENVGLYKVANTGSLLVIFGQLAINGILAPQIVKLYNAHDIENLQRVITLGTRVVAAISLPVALFFIFFSEQLIEWFFGVEYLTAATTLTILTLGQLINALTGPAVLVLQMTGHEKLTVKSVILTIVLAIFLSFILVPFYGLLGAAITTVTSLTISKLVVVWWAYKYTGLKLLIR